MDTMADEAPWLRIHRELGVIDATFDDDTVGERVSEYARDMGQRPALRFFHRDISYAELDEYANRLANVLVGLGVTPDDVVGLHMPNIPQYGVALVALSRIGCAGSGVSPLLAPAELAHQIADAGITVLISLDELARDRVPAMAPAPECLRAVLVTTATDHLAPQPSTLPDLGAVAAHPYLASIEAASPRFTACDAQWDDTCMIQYTGGTTGRPKGAMLSIRNLMSNAQITAAYAPFVPGEENLATAFPAFHVAGLCNVLGGLAQGARVLMIPDPRDIGHFCRQMIDCPPTRLAAVPTLYQMLLDHPDSARIDFTRLKIALTGAAPLTGEDRTRIEALIGRGKLCDVFGMTETSPVHVMNPPGRVKPASVGIPLPGMETRIVDLETGTTEMPVGEPGEIITAGPQVMKGYLNLPEESARAMRQWRGRTWMYTGDVGYMDEDGYIYLCDRAKDMLIVGGYKVFSVEVEDKLAALPFVAQSAVVGTPDPDRAGSEIVHLYVQPAAAGSERDEAGLREEIIAYCRANMSPYKVPRVIHFVDALPLTPVGKIDKKVLRQQAG